MAPAAGRKPKPEAERRNQNRPMLDWIQVIDVPYDGPVPALGGTVPARTKLWWAVVSRMPHCVLWDVSDWEFAIGTAWVHAAWVRSKGAAGQASELRQREKLLGLTWDARRDLRIKYIDSTPPEEADTPVSLADRRKALEG